MTDSSIDNTSRKSEIDTYSMCGELVIHTILVKTRTMELDREIYQDPDSDRYLVPIGKFFDNAADDLVVIAVSKRSMSLLPQKEAVTTDLKPFKQETEPLAKIWYFKMEDDKHQPNELNSHLRYMKTYLKARYRLSNLLRVQRNDGMTSNLKMWIENGSTDKGDLEDEIYRILRQYCIHNTTRDCFCNSIKLNFYSGHMIRWATRESIRYIRGS